MHEDMKMECRFDQLQSRGEVNADGETPHDRSIQIEMKGFDGLRDVGRGAELNTAGCQDSTMASPASIPESSLVKRVRAMGSSCAFAERSGGDKSFSYDSCDQPQTNPKRR